MKENFEHSPVFSKKKIVHSITDTYYLLILYKLASFALKLCFAFISLHFNLVMCFYLSYSWYFGLFC